jgi:hypothetical protein
MFGPAASGRRPRRSGVADGHRHFVIAGRRGEVFDTGRCANRCSHRGRVVHSLANNGANSVSCAHRHADSDNDPFAVAVADFDPYS